jgi:hypothetical protein
MTTSAARPRVSAKCAWLLRRLKRLSLKSLAANEVPNQLHARAYNSANFQRTLVLLHAVADWPLNGLRDRPIKIGAKAKLHARPIILQLAEAAIPRNPRGQKFAAIANLQAKAQAS